MIEKVGKYFLVVVVLVGWIKLYPQPNPFTLSLPQSNVLSHSHTHSLSARTHNNGKGYIAALAHVHYFQIATAYFPATPAKNVAKTKVTIIVTMLGKMSRGSMTSE